MKRRGGIRNYQSIEMHLAKEMEVLNFFRKLYAESMDMMDRLRPKQEQSLTVGVYLRLVELAGALLTLIESRDWIGVPIILRSMIESYADLKNLFADPTYARRMEATVAQAWTKLLEKARKGENPFLADLSDADQEHQLFQQHSERLQELLQQGFKPLQPHERFEIAGLASERVVYGRLSAETHGDAGAVLRRHLILGEGEPRLVLHPEPKIETILVWADSAAGLLLSATEIAHKHLCGGRPERVKILQKEFSRVRAS
jgi:hypothetical protein